MTRPSKIRILGASLALAFVLPLAACGETPPSNTTSGTALPDASEEQLIDGVTPADQVETETDPTPQSSTGGGIPGAEGGTATGASPGTEAPAGGTAPAPAQ